MSLTAFFGAPVKGPSTPPPALKQSRVEEEQVPSAIKVKPPVAAKKHQGDAAAKTKQSAKKAPPAPAKKGAGSKAAKKGAKGRAAVWSQAADGKAQRTRKVVMMGKGSVTSEWKLLRLVGVKIPKSAFTLWAGEHRKKIQKEVGTTEFAVVSKAVGEAWFKLTEEEKKPYFENAKVLKEKYKEARVAYDEYLKTTMKRDSKARENKKRNYGTKVLAVPGKRLKLQQGKKAPVKAAQAKKAVKKAVKKATKPAPSASTASGAGGKSAPLSGVVAGGAATGVVAVQDDGSAAVPQVEGPGDAATVAPATVAQVATPVKRSMRSFRIPKDDQPAPSPMEDGAAEDSDAEMVGTPQGVPAAAPEPTGGAPQDGAAEENDAEMAGAPQGVPAAAPEPTEGAPQAEAEAEDGEGRRE